MNCIVCIFSKSDESGRDAQLCVSKYILIIVILSETKFSEESLNTDCHFPRTLPKLNHQTDVQLFV